MSTNKNRRRTYYAASDESCMKGNYLFLSSIDGTVAYSNTGSNFSKNKVKNSSLTGSMLGASVGKMYYQFGNTLLIEDGSTSVDLTKIKSKSTSEGFKSTNYVYNNSAGIDNDIVLCTTNYSNKIQYTTDGVNFNDSGHTGFQIYGRLLKIGDWYVLSKDGVLYTYSSRENLINNSYSGSMNTSPGYTNTSNGYSVNIYPFFIGTDGTYVHTYMYYNNFGSWNVVVHRYSISSTGTISKISEINAKFSSGAFDDHELLGQANYVVNRHWDYNKETGTYSYVYSWFDEFQNGTTYYLVEINPSAWSTEYNVMFNHSTLKFFFNNSYTYGRVEWPGTKKVRAETRINYSDGKCRSGIGLTLSSDIYDETWTELLTDTGIEGNSYIFKINY